MFKKATIEDIPAIQRMADVVFRETYKTILSPEQMEYMMDMMYSTESLTKQLREGVFFIEEGKGFASVRPDGVAEDGRARFHLEKLYVMPDSQKSGLGKELFQAVCDYVRQTAPVLLELNVNRNNPALGFYEHLGMRRARQGDFAIGRGFYMNDYIMSIDIPGKC